MTDDMRDLVERLHELFDAFIASIQLPVPPDSFTVFMNSLNSDAERTAFRIKPEVMLGPDKEAQQILEQRHLKILLDDTISDLENIMNNDEVVKPIREALHSIASIKARKKHAPSYQLVEELGKSREFFEQEMFLVCSEKAQTCLRISELL